MGGGRTRAQKAALQRRGARQTVYGGCVRWSTRNTWRAARAARMNAARHDHGALRVDAEYVICSCVGLTVWRGERRGRVRVPAHSCSVAVVVVQRHESQLAPRASGAFELRRPAHVCTTYRRAPGFGRGLRRVGAPRWARRAGRGPGFRGRLAGCTKNADTAWRVPYHVRAIPPLV